MSEDIEFGIIIPVYNGAKFIERSLDSINKQTYRNFNIVIVDDGSTDETKKVIKKYIENNPTLKINYIYQNNAGPGYARAKGIECVNCDYIAFLDSDDICSFIFFCWHIDGSFGPG